MCDEDLPDDIFPQIVRRLDFRTFVLWTMTNRKWAKESFQEIHSIDSYWCYHYHTATVLPHDALRELPEFLKRHISKFNRITELSLCCQWFYTQKTIMSMYRSDSSWNEPLFPLIEMNARHLTRLELQDYDGILGSGEPDLLDALIGQLGPQLKELALLNIWITEFTIDAISKLKCSLDVLSFEGSSLSQSIVSDRIAIIEKLLAAPAVKTARFLRLPWSITTPIAPRFPNRDTFPNVEYLDLGTSLTDEEPTSVAAWETVIEKILSKVPGINPTQILTRGKDLFCDAIVLQTSIAGSFDAAMLSYFAGIGFTPDLYRDIGYFETDTRRIFRTHPIVSALGTLNFAAADLLVQHGYVDYDLSNLQKMKLLLRIGEAPTASVALSRLEWIGRQSPSVIKRLLPVGKTGIPIFFSAAMTESFDTVIVALSRFLTSRTDIVELLQLDIDFNLGKECDVNFLLLGGEVTIANVAKLKADIVL